MIIRLIKKLRWLVSVFCLYVMALNIHENAVDDDLRSAGRICVSFAPFLSWTLYRETGFPQRHYFPDVVPHLIYTCTGFDGQLSIDALSIENALAQKAGSR